MWTTVVVVPVFRRRPDGGLKPGPSTVRKSQAFQSPRVLASKMNVTLPVTGLFENEIQQ